MGIKLVLTGLFIYLFFLVWGIETLEAIAAENEYVVDEPASADAAGSETA